MALLTVSEAAARLACSEGLVYHLCSEGKLLHARFGTGRGTIRIEETDLSAFVEACKVIPKAFAEGLKHITVKKTRATMTPNHTGNGSSCDAH